MQMLFSFRFNGIELTWMILCTPIHFLWYISQDCTDTGQTSSSQVNSEPGRRPRRRWSHRVGLMVKSMLDLRQLEAFSHRKNHQERQSSSSLQEPVVYMIPQGVYEKRHSEQNCFCGSKFHCFIGPYVFFLCSSRWRRGPGDISLGHTLVGCPRIHPRALGAIME